MSKFEIDSVEWPWKGLKDVTRPLSPGQHDPWYAAHSYDSAARCPRVVPASAYVALLERAEEMARAIEGITNGVWSDDMGYASVSCEVLDELPVALARFRNGEG